MWFCITNFDLMTVYYLACSAVFCFSPECEFVWFASLTVVWWPRLSDMFGRFLVQSRVIVCVVLLCQACHVTLLFQVKTENPPLLFCLLIYNFLSSGSIKPMTTILVFLRGGRGVYVCVHVCVWHVCVLKWMCLSAFVSTLGSHEMGRYKLPIIIIILHH